MLVPIPDFLTAVEVAHMRERLSSAPWVDGRITAGHQSAKAKDNTQLPEDHPLTRELGEVVLKAVERNPLFMTAALPRRVFPPLFNRYERGQSFGTHVDNAVRQIKGTMDRIRTDMSATLFLTAPGDYDGGELVIDDVYGAHKIKLPAGSLILYPAGSLHYVVPVTRGARRAAGVVLLDPEHGARRWRAHAAVRPRHLDPQADGDKRGSDRARSADGHVSQSFAAMG